MSDEMNTGNASENGEKNTTQSTNTENTNPQTVPYGRFQEVNAKRKAAEDALASIVDELCGDVPEDMRGLIPNLPAPEKVKWLREARAKGLFNVKTADSPDSKRPTGKQPEDLSGLSPVAQMARGYKTTAGA